MMLYPKNQEKKLSATLFANPTAEYRGTPFWSWNCMLEQGLLDEEIEHMKTMGLGGFHMHSRSGLATEYLSDEFMQRVKDSVEKAKSLDMLAWLYDEDRWPSGFGGGYVTQDIKYRERYLNFVPTPYEIDKLDHPVGGHGTSPRTKNGHLLATYTIELDSEGILAGYRRLKEGEKAEGNIWYAYLDISPDSPWFNNTSYVDTLNPEAIRKFVEVTHQRYYDVVGEDFGKTIPAIFTDEPQTSSKHTLNFAAEKRDISMPFTDTLPDTFKAAYGYDLLDKLPELYWELPEGKVSTTRYHYHDHVAERFAEAFADVIGGWCSKHDLMMTGHMMNEVNLWAQTIATGEAMRSYRSFGLPGIDMLCDWRELATAKQAQSACHQYGYPGVLSELYGVTGWDFDFRGHKLQGDWQAALGITVRVHHLYWASMAGEAKRDYPACIGHQSPWFEEYSYVEDHFARVHTALTRGKPHVRIGVLHPIESYWLHWGPNEQTEAICLEMDRRFTDLTTWLLYATLDFDFICESLLPDQYKKSAKGFQIGDMNYDAVIVPFCETIRATTLAALTEFANRGGKVIFAGEPPRLVDAKPSDEPAKLATRTSCIPFSEGAVLAETANLREIDIRDSKGIRSTNLITQTRQDGDTRWLFICHVNHPVNALVAIQESYRITLKGEFSPVCYDTLTGAVKAYPAVCENGNTIIEWNCFCHDSLLLALETGKPAALPAAPKEAIYLGEVTDRLPVTLLEPNTLVLDMAEFSLDGGSWESTEELLRLDDILRNRLGYATRNSAFTQPWTVPYIAPTHSLKIRFTLHSETEITGASIAMEDAEQIALELNGKAVASTVTGWFVDASIKTVALPVIPAGKSSLVLTLPYGPKTNVEWCYLLGNFGVRVQGRHCTILPAVRELAFGDWTSQGLPFYSGNLVYHATVEGSGKPVTIEFPQFACPALTVAVDDKRVGIVAYAPYTISLGNLPSGSHKVDITVQNSRVNAFGGLHCCDDKEKWLGPNIWRTTGNSWSYEYQLKKSGILVAPRIYTQK